MSISRRVAMFVSGTAISIAAAYVVLVTAIQVQQLILRHRAERLFADVQSLPVRRPTFAEAAAAFSHGSSNGSHSVPCSPESCHFSMGLYDFGSASGQFPGWSMW